MLSEPTHYPQIWIVGYGFYTSCALFAKKHGAKIEYSGLEHMLCESPKIFAFRHKHKYDTGISTISIYEHLGELPIHVMVKKRYKGDGLHDKIMNLISGLVLGCSGGRAVLREKDEPNARVRYQQNLPVLQSLQEDSAQGRSIVVHPEGTTSWDTPAPVALDRFRYMQKINREASMIPVDLSYAGPEEKPLQGPIQMRAYPGMPLHHKTQDLRDYWMDCITQNL